MSLTQIASVAPTGASRSRHSSGNYDRGHAVNEFKSRGGVYETLEDSASNLGLGVGAIKQRSTYRSSGAWQLRGQSVAYQWQVPLNCQKPGVRFKWPNGLHGIEVCLAWDAPTTGLGESGVFFAQGTHRQPLAQTALAFGVNLRNNGVIEWISRPDPGTLERVALGGAGPYASWNKLRVELRDATFDAEASVQVYLNDTLALTRLWGAGTVLPAVEANGAFIFHLMQDETVNSLFYKDLNFFDGPDVAGL